MIRAIPICAVLVALAACSNSQKIDPMQQVGPDPVLPKVNEPVLLPRTNLPSVVGWKKGELPTVPAGFEIKPMATGLMSPRSVYPLANGDILVVQSLKGGKEPIERLKNPFFDLIFGSAHATSEKGPTNRITLLRDANGDGTPELQSVLIDHLNSPFGIVLVGDDLYVAETDKITRFPFIPGQTQTLPLAIYTFTQVPGGDAQALRLSLVAVVLSIAALAASEWLTRRATESQRDDQR